jgi:hypothetical protein
VLTAIVPDGNAKTITARNANEVDAFVGAYNGKRNIYFSVNPTRAAMSKKAAKVDIAAVEYLLADLDPMDDESPEAAKARYLEALETNEPKPAAIIDSGNGIQVLFRLREPIDIGQYLPVKDKDGNLVLAPEAATLVKDVETRVKALMLRLGSKAGTQNIDRILRLPGTTNLPNAKKIKDGRVPCQAKLIRFNGATCKLEDFPTEDKDSGNSHSDTREKPEGPIDWANAEQHAGWLKTVADLPSDFSAKGKMIVAYSGTLKDLNADLKQAGLVEKTYNSWSDVSLALAAIFKADGRFQPEQIAAALMCRLECNQHLSRQNDKRRAVERLLNHSHEPAAQRIKRMLCWRAALMAAHCQACTTPGSR